MRKRPKVDTLFSSLFTDASERRAWLSAESINYESTIILASSFGRFRLYRLKPALVVMTWGLSTNNVRKLLVKVSSLMVPAGENVEIFKFWSGDKASIAVWRSVLPSNEQSFAIKNYSLCKQWTTARFGPQYRVRVRAWVNGDVAQMVSALALHA